MCIKSELNNVFYHTYQKPVRIAEVCGPIQRGEDLVTERGGNTR